MLAQVVVVDFLFCFVLFCSSVLFFTLLGIFVVGKSNILMIDSMHVSKTYFYVKTLFLFSWFDDFHNVRLGDDRKF